MPSQRASFIADTDLGMRHTHGHIIRRFAENEEEWMDFFDSALDKFIQRKD